MSPRDMPFSTLRRKAEGLGYTWDGTEFRHAELKLRVAPVPKSLFGGPNGTDCRETFQRLVTKYNDARQAQGVAA